MNIYRTRSRVQTREDANISHPDVRHSNIGERALAVGVETGGTDGAQEQDMFTGRRLGRAQVQESQYALMPGVTPHAGFTLLPLKKAFFQ